MAVIGKLPRFSAASGMCFRRGMFLNGEQPTYFAPGQKPDVVTLPGSLQGGSSPYFAKEYYPPTDWRPAGGILTPPQVVWLCLAQLDAATPTYTTSVPSYVMLESISTALDDTLPLSGSLTDDQFPLTLTYTDGVTITIQSNQAAFNASKSGTLDPSWLGRVYILPPYNPYTAYLYPPYSNNQARLPIGYIPGTALYALGTEITWGQFDTDGVTYCGIQPYTLLSGPNAVQTTSNAPNVNDYQALSAAFSTAASQINLMRTGKTWVQIYDYTQATADAQQWLISKSQWNKSDAGMIVPPYFSHLIAPPATSPFLPPTSTSATPFFGVDFLMIHAGGWASGGSPVSSALFESLGGLPAAALNPSIIAVNEANIEAAYKSFSGFAVQLYSGKPIPKLNYAPFTPIQFSGNTVPVTLYNREWQYPGFIYDSTNVDSMSTSLQVMAAYNAINLATYNSQTANNVGVPDGLVSALQSVAADLADYGYTYAGDESQLASSDSVVQAIASWFGFDPNTGADLPPSTGG